MAETTNNSSNEIRHAGDVNIRRIQVASLLTGHTLNITSQVMAVQIYEDLFSPFITGSLIVKDSLNLTNWLPFLGQEWVEINIITPTLKTEIKGNFYIYKITDREHVAEKSIVYQIHFISAEAIVDLNSALSRPFYGKISDIVGLLCSDPNYLSTPLNINIEETANSTKFVSNFWSIVKCINYLAGHAKTKEGETGYLFFQNRSGYNFCSLTYLNKMPINQKFTNGTTSLDVKDAGGSARVLQREYQQIHEMSIPTVFDVIDRTRNGTYASKITTHDWTTKRFMVNIYDYLKEFKKETRLNAYPLTNNEVIASAGAMGLTMEFSTQMHAGFGDVTNRKIVQDRISRLKQAEAFKVRLTVKGRTDYTVGMTVELDVNNASPTRKEDQPLHIKDRQYCGKYLVSAINHYINAETGHECHMEVIRDTFFMDPLPNSKFIEEKRTESFFE